MAQQDDDDGRAVLIDYAAGAPTSRLTYAARLPLGSVTLSRCTFHPNPGIALGSAQVMIAVHSTPSFELEWRDPERDPLQRTTVNPGDIHLIPPDLPVFHRWVPTTQAVVIALDRAFVTRTIAEAFDGTDGELRPLIGVSDHSIDRLVGLCDQEIAEGGAWGRRDAESLATALVVYLFRR